MKRKRMLSALLVVAMAATMFAGCGNKGGSNSSTQGGKAANDGDIKEFTAFFAVPGSEINDDNEVQQIIAEKTGVKVKETWLTGQTAEEAIGTLVAGDEYPDFICGGNGMPQLYDAGALVALDDYIDKYPNIKNYFTEQEWDQLRQDDGHIYWIPQFSNIKGEEKTCTHNDEAFWIQARVLEWANYPEIKTMDDYFKLIEDYNAANPTMEDGTENIPYTILCEDWRYFCLENAPQFLDGYPNDGSCMVDPDTLKVMDYNTSDTAVKYFKKLNEEYQKGIVDPESFTQTYDEYIAKLLADGGLVISDVAAQCIASLAMPEDKPERFLEIGAGRGTKTILLQNAALTRFGEQIHLDTLDMDVQRTEERKKQLAKANINQGDVFVKDATNLSSFDPDSYDAVFVDAPCSGVGTLRRHPDIRWRMNEDDVASLAVMGEKMILEAARLVKVGGQLTFATCTVLSQENQRVIDSFLKSEVGSGFEVVRTASTDALSREKVTGPIYDAHYACVLKRVK